MTIDFKVPSQAVPKQEVQATPQEVEVETWFESFYYLASTQSERTLQKNIGPSELGEPCERKLWCKAHGVPPVRTLEPSHAANVGTGIHMWLEQRMEALYGNTGRFMQETPIEYRGITGHADVYDRLKKRLIDYKTVTKARLGTLRKTRVVPPAYRIQAQTYAAGLIEAGFEVEEISIIFIPRDGNTLDVAAFNLEVDRDVADEAIDRLERIIALKNMEDAKSVPSPYCEYCS